MKKQFYYFSIALVATCLLAQSCNNEPSNKPEPTAEEGTLDSFYCQLKSIDQKDGGYVAIVDKQEFLTGDAAIAAARKNGEAEMSINEKGDTAWSVMNDYYIFNPDTNAVAMPVAAEVTINLANPETGQPQPPTTMSAFLAAKQLHNFPYSMKTKGGKIVGIRMQWVP